jgi:glycosyltransferase involved in cell wall biosynthesis
MNSKKIIIVGPAHPFRGGIAAFDERMAFDLQQTGHDVEIVNFTTQYPGFLFPGKTQFTSDPAPANLKITRLLSSVNPFSWIKTALYIRKQQPDLVILRFWIPFMGPALGSVARLLGKKVKVVGFVDNLIPHEKRIGDTLLSKYFVNACNGFITLSNQVKDEIACFTDKECLMSPHPVYDHYGNKSMKKESCKQLNLNFDTNYILFFGFIRNYKGLDLLIKAFSESNLRIKNYKLLVAGEFYEDEKRYLDLITSLQLNDYIELHSHYIPDAEIKYYFGACDLVVQPYRSATQSGISQLAYHFEKPMIVTNVGGLPEIVKDHETGFVTDVNPTAIAKAMNDFTEGDIHRFDEAIRQEKTKYTWSYLSQTILHFIP